MKLIKLTYTGDAGEFYLNAAKIEIMRKGEDEDCTDIFAGSDMATPYQVKETIEEILALLK